MIIKRAGLKKHTAKVRFSDKAMLQMLTLLLINKEEVAWHGITKKLGKGQYEITEILVYPQVVTGTSVNTDEAEYTNWMTSMALYEPELFDNMHFQGHSHVNMGTSPSLTDVNHQSGIIELLADDDYYIFVIINKSMETTWRIIDKQDGITYYDVIWDVDNDVVEDTKSESKSSVKRYFGVKRKPHKSKSAKQSVADDNEYYRSLFYGA